MGTQEERYDEAMFAFSQGRYPEAIQQLRALLAEDPSFFDAQLSIAMAYCRAGDLATAIAEGHAAERLRPQEQLVHTNLSLFYLRAGDKPKAEHHALQARIASWRTDMAPPGQAAPAGDDGSPEPPTPAQPAGMAAATSPLPDMPWKKPSPSSKFVAVAEVASLAPGQGRTVSAAGAELALYNLGGEFFAIADRCPHRGGTLGAGYLDADGHLFCPLHGWKFDLRSGACLSRPDRPVARYATRVRDGRIEVEL